MKRLSLLGALAMVLSACSGESTTPKDSGVDVDLCSLESKCSAEKTLSPQDKANCNTERKSVCGSKYDALLKCGAPHVVCDKDNKIDAAATQTAVVQNCGVQASGYLACTIENPPDSGTPDAGQPDAGKGDAGQSDAGSPDGGTDGG